MQRKLVFNASREKWLKTSFGDENKSYYKGSKLFSVVFEWLFSRLVRSLVWRKKNDEPIFSVQKSWNKVNNKSNFLPFLFVRLNSCQFFAPLFVASCNATLWIQVSWFFFQNSTVYSHFWSGIDITFHILHKWLNRPLGTKRMEKFG